MAASVTSARDGSPLFARPSSTWVAQMAGYVGGLAKPENLLLNLGEPIKADLDGEVAAGDHHSDGRMVERFQKNSGKLLEGASSLDLHDDPHARPTETGQLVPEPLQVCRRMNEREAD